MTESLEFVIFGAGAVGASIGTWVYPNYPHVSLLARGEHAAVMKEQGVTMIQYQHPKKSEKISVPVIDDLEESSNANVVILSVKNYSLEEAAKTISEKLGDPVVVTIQNGVENQKILPRYFSKLIFGVYCPNAWLKESHHIRNLSNFS